MIARVESLGPDAGVIVLTDDQGDFRSWTLRVQAERPASSHPAQELDISVNGISVTDIVRR